MSKKIYLAQMLNVGEILIYLNLKFKFKIY